MAPISVTPSKLKLPSFTMPFIPLVIDFKQDRDLPKELQRDITSRGCFFLICSLWYSHCHPIWLIFLPASETLFWEKGGWLGNDHPGCWSATCRRAWMRSNWSEMRGAPHTIRPSSIFIQRHRRYSDGCAMLLLPLLPLTLQYISTTGHCNDRLLTIVLRREWNKQNGASRGQGENQSLRRKKNGFATILSAARSKQRYQQCVNCLIFKFCSPLI